MPCTYSPMEGGSCRYSAATRLGNWYEEHCRELDQIRIFKQQRDSGELVVDKAALLCDTFYKKIQLDAPKPDLRFNSVVQLMPTNLCISDVDTTDMNPALSVVANERVVTRKQASINEDCELTVAPSDYPCLRNCFRIVGCDGKDHSQELLHYGQHFRLQCMEPVNEAIWLYSAPKLCNLSQTVVASYASQTCGEVNLSLGLMHSTSCGPGSELPCAFANWFCVHKEPLMRFETEGEKVPSNTPLVLVHAATNKYLAAENVVIQTLFGPEFLVSVQSYTRRNEIWKNHWMFSNGHHN